MATRNSTSDSEFFEAVLDFTKKFGMVLQKAMKQGRNVHVFRYVMHDLTLQHQGCVHTFGHMPTSFLFQSAWVLVRHISGIQMVKCTL